MALHIKRAALAAAFTAALSLAGTLAFAPAASAANQNGVCESGEICVYRLPEGTGGTWDGDQNIRRYWNHHYYGSSGNINNNATSLWNRTGSNVRFYDLGYCQLSNYTINLAPGSAVGDLHGSTMNNRISSHCRIAG